MIDGEDDNIELEVGGEDEAGEVAQQETEQAAEPVDDGDELEIEIEGEEGVEETPLQKKLRQEIRQRDRRIAELEAKSAPAAVEVGEEPTLESCEWDEDRLKREYSAWERRRDEAANRENAQRQARQAVMDAQERAFATTRANAIKLGLKTYDEAEESVRSSLPEPLVNAIPLLFEDKAPALMVALHRHPHLAEKIVSTMNGDPNFGALKAIVALSNMATGVKMVPKRKTQTAPEEIVTGGAPLSSGGPDRHEQQLEKEAARTQDYTKLFAYQRQKREAAKSKAA